MFTTRKAIVSTLVAGAVALAVALTGCAPEGEKAVAIQKLTHSTPMPVATCEPTSCVEPPPHEEATSGDGDSTDPQGQPDPAVIEYLMSDERMSMYDGLFYQSGTTIASALLAGSFGETYKYNSMKEPKPDGYTGWGGIATAKDRTDGVSMYAWVYWLPDGTIDFTQGIGGLSIDAGFDERNVQVESNSIGTWRWLPFLARYDGSKSPSTTINIDGGEGNGDTKTVSSLRDIKQLDADVLETLNTNMEVLFGPSWRD